jgi:hypothetical protein
MTTYVGKDVTIEYDVDGDDAKEVLALAQECSIEVDNGRTDIKEIGSSIIQEFNYTGVSVSGTLTIVPSADTANASLDNLFDLVHPAAYPPQSDEDMDLKFGSTPDYTVTITEVAFGALSFSVGLEDVVTFELPFVGKNISYA